VCTRNSYIDSLSCLESVSYIETKNRFYLKLKSVSQSTYIHTYPPVSPRNHTPRCRHMFPTPNAVQSVQNVTSHRVEQLKGTGSKKEILGNTDKEEAGLGDFL
jgi:hypothetical protein